jgi:Family of unknown function (DUF5335)
MSQQMRQPVRQEWRGFLDSVTHELEGEPVTVEVVTAELGSRVEADRLPLSFINYDEKDEAVYVSVRGREGGDAVLEHIVQNPWKILFDPPSPSAVRTIDIEGPDGSHTLVTLHGRELAGD